MRRRIERNCGRVKFHQSGAECQPKIGQYSLEIVNGVRGVTVSMVAFQAIGRGSTPLGRSSLLTKLQNLSGSSPQPIVDPKCTAPCPEYEVKVPFSIKFS